MEQAVSPNATPPGTPDMARLLVRCDDRPGIVAAISRFLFERGANIAQSDQYSTDPEGGRFFLRMVFHLPGVDKALEDLRAGFAREVGEPLGLDFRIELASTPKRLA